MDRFENHLFHLHKEKCSYHFFSVAWGTSNPREMIVRWLFGDSKSGKKYLVFTPADDITEKYLREYFGDYREERYIRIADRQIIHAINKHLTVIDKEESDN